MNEHGICCLGFCASLTRDIGQGFSWNQSLIFGILKNNNPDRHIILSGDEGWRIQVLSDHWLM